MPFGRVGVIGQCFSKDEHGNAETVNGARYRNTISNFLWPILDCCDTEEMWSRQDGATCHTSGSTIALLPEKLDGRLVSLRGDRQWPPRSCDLTACHSSFRAPLNHWFVQTNRGFDWILSEKFDELLANSMDMSVEMRSVISWEESLRVERVDGVLCTIRKYKFKKIITFLSYNHYNAWRLFADALPCRTITIQAYSSIFQCVFSGF